MGALSSRTVLDVWERGHGQHPLERDLTVLVAACPDRSRHELALLSIGQRDTLLLRVHGQTFGDLLETVVSCPRCDEKLEFELSASMLEGKDGAEIEGQPEHRLRSDHLDLKFRLPNSYDIATALQRVDAADAGQALFECCVFEASRSGQSIEAAELDEDEVAAIGEAIAAADPMSEINLKLDCPACEQTWDAPFAVGAFLWSELEDRVSKLLAEVDLLARAYSWGEDQILSLSEARRNAYLSLIESR